MIRPILKAYVLISCLFLSACVEGPGEHRAEFVVFGTIMEVSVYGASDENSGAAFAELQNAFQQMHREWHAWEPGLLTDINRAFAENRPATASSDIVEMVRYSQTIEELSGGRFNPAIGALIRLWGFHTSDYPIIGPPPDRARIDELLENRPSSGDIQIDRQIMTSTNPAVQLDFGGIAKGHAIDRACEILRNRGIDNAIVNAGGDLRAIGRHGERAWRIAIRNPAGGIIGTLETGPDEAVFTSGVYERFRQENERRYPHILDPRTGWPVDELTSVTVIAGKGVLADAAATALIVAGLADWAEVARALALEQVLLVDESGKVYLTPMMDQRIDFIDRIEKEIMDFQDLGG